MGLTDRVPRAHIRWYLGKIHVGTPDSEVEADIRERIAKNPDATPEEIEACVAYALECHHANLDLYRSVMGGRL